jgi:hypothetical protein
MDVFTADWPSGLKTVEQAAADLCIGPNRLLDLANGGFAPHYRIDGGAPLFRISELKRWAAVNLMQVVEGRDRPAPVRVIAPAPRVVDFRKVPQALREIVGLCDITDEIMRTGVYFLCRDGCVLYVGQSINAAARVAEHYRRYEFESVLFLPWPGDDLDRLEAALIRELRPPLNGKTSNGHMRAPLGGDDAAVIAGLTNAPAVAETGAENRPTFRPTDHAADANPLITQAE